MALPERPRRKPQPPKNPPGPGAVAGVDFGGLRTYFEQHRRMARDSLLRLLATPLASLLTWAVIAIALALPASLFVLLSNVAQLGQGWSELPRVTLYLELGTSDAQARELAERLRARADVGAVEYVSPAAALEEFRQISGLGEVIQHLDENPLPPVILATPAASLASAEAVGALAEELGRLPRVERAQLDRAWVQRLFSLVELVERGVIALALMFAGAVLLVVGNTIRLAIENRREEILVVKLVGGTDAFVRRPFLYTGIWYGLGGAILAWLLVWLWLAWLSAPVEELARLYFIDLELIGLGLESTLTLLIAGMALGWAGAWLALRRHLSDIEPR